jgi:hypothetical protein
MARATAERKRCRSGVKQQRHCDKQRHHTAAVEIITSSLAVGSNTR